MEIGNEKQSEVTQIGYIGNVEGGLYVKNENGKRFWPIKDWNGFSWDEIPEHLYDALMQYESGLESIENSAKTDGSDDDQH